MANNTIPNNLPQSLIDMLNINISNYKPTPFCTSAEAGDRIWRFTKVALLKQSGRDVDNLVIFDPTAGVWVHDDNTFVAVITIFKGYASANAVKTILSGLAAQARIHNNFIKPYAGSRYLLFNNGCLDVKTMRIHPVSSKQVRDLHFTTRSHIDLDYVHNPADPHFANGLTHGTGDWTPSGFIKAYANNDSKRLLMLLFGLSLGLFGGHNFGAHFDIQGDSRWGKTTLSQIFQNLYPGRVMMLPWSSLNSQFAFTSYDINKSIIWINECNMDAAPLDDTHGTVAYDGLADNPARFQVKGTDDLVINNPPQVYIDGTQLVQANENTNGPAGRTIPFELPAMTPELLAQSRATDIKKFLRDPKTLQWLVFWMIQSYRKIIPANQIDDYVVSKADDPALTKHFPDAYHRWRDDMLTQKDEVFETFVYFVKPYLTDTTDPDDPHVTLLHPSILYILYNQHHQQANNIGYGRTDRYMMSSKRFFTKIKRLFDQYGYATAPIGKMYDDRVQPRKRISSINSINFDWKSYFENNKIPDEFADQSNPPFPFRCLVVGWFKIYQKK